MGAGILPVAVFKNKLYFLFGLENEYADTPGWADFGGGREKKETNYETAIREGCEELNGFLGCGKKLAKLAKKNRVSEATYEHYTTYIFQVAYDEKLPQYFSSNYKFVRHRLNNIVKKDNGLFEKSEIKWFSFDELRETKRKFRPFYRNIVNEILSQEKEITKKMRKMRKTRKIR